jgi:hypothetical protein
VGTQKAHIVMKSSINDALIWHMLESGDAGFVAPGDDGSDHFYYEEWLSTN